MPSRLSCPAVQPAPGPDMRYWARPGPFDVGSWAGWGFSNFPSHRPDGRLGKLQPTIEQPYGPGPARLPSGNAVRRAPAADRARQAESGTWVGPRLPPLRVDSNRPYATLSRHRTAAAGDLGRPTEAAAQAGAHMGRPTPPVTSALEPGLFRPYRESFHR